MRFKKSRIAWSVFFGLACLLLINAWVGNYERNRLLNPVEHWIDIAITAFFAIAPWIRELTSLRWRFSLRTLLIVMTAVSVALGLIVGLSRR